MSEDRFIELEIKIAYQEDLLQILNDGLSEQQQQIIRLEKTCQLLAGRIKNIANVGEGINQSAEIPPHY